MLEPALAHPRRWRRTAVPRLRRQERPVPNYYQGSLEPELVQEPEQVAHQLLLAPMVRVLHYQPAGWDLDHPRHWLEKRPERFELERSGPERHLVRPRHPVPNQRRYRQLVLAQEQLLVPVRLRLHW